MFLNGIELKGEDEKFLKEHSWTEYVLKKQMEMEHERNFIAEMNYIPPWFDKVNMEKF